MKGQLFLKGWHADWGVKSGLGSGITTLLPIATMSLNYTLCVALIVWKAELFFFLPPASERQSEHITVLLMIVQRNIHLLVPKYITIMIICLRPMIHYEVHIFSKRIFSFVGLEEIRVLKVMDFVCW